ncbi:ankyrin repeat domain-containing protein [Brachybacterium sp. JHP9]|uniref:Ankyrin repeat domain-containing protein n=1 Tax=Brachybacterium equifaecis TaxID=2910770 RepID=A0ABT0QWB4_9MICO|nr:ankyrin repeat domain-containing protein [Brachybacterium equifaecis]MCL6421957.1 ankyrin repeat domain-containing protein [Brachybacterium equifaecis]
MTSTPPPAEATSPEPYESSSPASDSVDPAVLDLAHRMFDAARAGDAALLLSLLEQGAPANLQDPQGNTLLMLAAYHGHADLVRELAARGADVDQVNDRGQSPLAGAAFKGTHDVAAALLEAGADPDLGTPSARDTAAYFKRGEITALFDETRA